MTEATCKIATSQDEFDEAFRLVYKAYYRCGLVLAHPRAMRVLPHHLVPTTEVLVAVENSEVLATLSLIRDGELGLPMESIYGAEVDHKRRHGIRIAEASCLADRASGLTQSLPIVFKLMAFFAQCAERRGVDEILVAVHPHHAGFYLRYLGFEAFARRKQYEAVCNNPAVALSLDLNRLAVTNPRAYRRLFGPRFSDESLQPRSMQPDLRAVYEEYDEYATRSEDSERPLLHACA